MFADDCILITLALTCTTLENTFCPINPFTEFAITTPSGSVKEPVSALMEMLEGKPNEYFSGEAKAWLVFEVDQNESNLVLRFTPSSGADKAYLAIQ